MIRRKMVLVWSLACGLVFAVSMAVGVWFVNEQFGVFVHPNLKKMIADAEPLIREINEHKSRYGECPIGFSRLSGKEGGQSTNELISFGWYYAGDAQSYSMYRYTGHLRDTLWYGGEPFADHRYRWYLDDESGNPVKELNVNGDIQ